MSVSLGTHLVDRLANPVDARISSNGLVLRIDHDDLEVLICRVLIDPVRVQDSQIGASSADTFFGG